MHTLRRLLSLRSDIKHSPPTPIHHLLHTNTIPPREKEKEKERNKMNPLPIHKAKPRPAASCAPCRNRKVKVRFVSSFPFISTPEPTNGNHTKWFKCDRLSPCEACIARGIAHECKYSSTDEDREAIAQAEVISTLRARARRLRNELAEAEAEGQEIMELRQGMSFNQGQGQRQGPDGGTGTSSGARKAENQAMEILYSAIRLGSEDLVGRIVSGVREGRELVDVVRMVQV